MARSKEFDRDSVLNKAMVLFWEKGYDAASIPELLKSMGISRSSMYDSFTDKKTLFIEALNHYESLGRRRLESLKNAPNVKEGLEQFFENHITLALDDEYPGGCFITNTATSYDVVDEQIREIVRDSFERLDEAFLDLLKRGQRTGEIAADKNLDVIVSVLQCLNHGINVMAKVHKDRRLLTSLVQEALLVVR